MQHYNQPTAPLYDFAKYPTSVPLAMFTGNMDELADPTDVAFLLESLPMAPVLHVVCLSLRVYRLLYNSAFGQSLFLS